MTEQPKPCRRCRGSGTDPDAASRYTTGGKDDRACGACGACGGSGKRRGVESFLTTEVRDILRHAPQPLRTPDIEFYLRCRGHCQWDTFDVRDAVAALVASGEAEWVHPGYYARLKP